MKNTLKRKSLLNLQKQGACGRGLYPFFHLLIGHYCVLQTKIITWIKISKIHCLWLKNVIIV